MVVNQNAFNRQMRGITSVAKKAGATIAAAFGVKKLIEFGKSCLDLGSDLAEVQNVVDVTFPSMTAQVDKFAQSAAKTFGLSETMAKQYTGTFGAMAKAFGFSEQQAYDMGTSLTALAGDVASFYNLSQDEAYTKLKSVFTGETESLKDLGVVMTQTALDSYALANGFGKTTAQMSEAEKVALRYQFVQEQLALANGDFARTSGGWANQVRILSLQFQSLKASIGQGLINVFTPVLKMINTLIGRLITLANAFKSFTELITGKKSSGSSASQMSDLGSAASDASTGLDNASDSADTAASSAKKAGSAAKKAAKEMRSLMGFDQVNKLSDPSDNDDNDDSDDDSGKSNTVPDIAPTKVNFGDLAKGETAIDKIDDKLKGLINKFKELANLFKKGFVIGFGDSEKRIASIKKHLENIGKILNEIFTDKKVVASANKLLNSIALNAGKVAGSMASIAVTIADNFVGGIDKYLQSSKEYIKNQIVSIFDVSARIFDLVGDFAVAFAEVFAVFSGENAKQCTASLIGIFADTFLGILNLALQFSADILEFITRPFVENKDKLIEAIDNTLAPISILLQTLHQGIKDIFGKINQVYETNIHPMFQSFTDGISEIVSVFLDLYNECISPVLDKIAEKFEDSWKNHVYPAIAEFIEFIGKVADLIKVLWEKVLQPFIKWIIQNIYPVIAPILEKVGEIVLNAFDMLSDVIGGILRSLGGVIDFVVGVFTGDWKRAWQGIADIFGGIWDGIVGILRVPVNAIIDIINKLVSAVASGVNGIADMLNSISIPEEIPIVGGLSFNLPNWTPNPIPYLAQGGYVKKNTPQLAMIGDNLHQGELVAPEDKLQAMVNTAVATVAGSGGVSRAELESIVNNAVMRIVAALSQMGFYLDGELMAKAVKKAQENLDMRYNPVRVI